MDELFARRWQDGIVRGDPDLIIQPPPPLTKRTRRKRWPSSSRRWYRFYGARRDAGAVAIGGAIRGLPGVIWVTEAPCPMAAPTVWVNFRGDILGAAFALRRAAGRVGTGRDAM